MDSGTWNDPITGEGHGTHTAGSLTGEPFTVSGVTYDIKGVAYNSQLVFQATLDPATSGVNKGVLDIPDLNSQGFPDAYGQGVRVHSDSWGGSIPGDYDDFAQSADTFIWEHKDFVACFAAGNGGVDANNDGVIDPDSVTSPGTAKDVITVGASENYRPDIWAHGTRFLLGPCSPFLQFRCVSGSR